MGTLEQVGISVAFQEENARIAQTTLNEVRFQLRGADPMPIPIPNPIPIPIPIPIITRYGTSSAPSSLRRTRRANTAPPRTAHGCTAPHTHTHTQITHTHKAHKAHTKHTKHTQSTHTKHTHKAHTHTHTLVGMLLSGAREMWQTPNNKR